MIERMIDRLYSAVAGMDVGIPTALLSNDLIRGANMALSKVGAPKLVSLENEGAIRRAVMALEAATD